MEGGVDSSAFGGDGGDVALGLGQGLLDGGIAAALIEPGFEAGAKGAVAPDRDDGDLGIVLLGVVVVHGGLVDGELLLDADAAVAGGALEIELGVGELVGVEIELGLGDLEDIGIEGIFAAGLGFDLIDSGTILGDFLLQLGDALGNSEGLAGEGAAASLEVGLAESGGEGLVDFVVGEMLGLAGVLVFFSGDGEGGESLGGLPGTDVDEGLAGGSALGTEKGEGGAGATGEPAEDEAEGQQGEENREDDEPDFAEDARVGRAARSGWGCRAWDFYCSWGKEEEGECSGREAEIPGAGGYGAPSALWGRRRKLQWLSSRAQGAAFDAFFVLLALKDALDVDAGRDDEVGVEGAGVDQLLDFGDGDAGGGSHHRVEVAGGLSIDKVAGAIAFPGFDEGEVGAEPGFEEVRAAVEGAGFFAFGDERAGSGGGEEGGDSGATGADAFGERALGGEAEVELALDDFVFEELIFADVGAGVGGDHAGFEHEAHAEAVDAHVVGDGVKAGEAAAAVLLDEGVDEVFGDAAEAESAEHEGCAGGDVGDGGFGGGDDFVHVGSGLGVTEKDSGRDGGWERGEARGGETSLASEQGEMWDGAEELRFWTG